MALSDAVRKLIAGTLGTVNLRNNLERLFSLYVEEAPQDGNTYGRQDGQWVIGGGGGQLPIQFQYQGIDLGSPGDVTTVDFTGAGVVAGVGGPVLTVTVAGGGAIRPIAFFDGSPDAVLAGSQARCTVTANCTITGWTILADVSGSCVVDILKSTYAGYPTVSSITASAKPTLTAATKATSTTLTGWTTALTAGDVLVFNVDSATTVKQIFIVLDVT